MTKTAKIKTISRKPRKGIDGIIRKQTSSYEVHKYNNGEYIAREWYEHRAEAEDAKANWASK